MTEFVPGPACSVCAHMVSPANMTCAAFPTGIPDEVWRDKIHHTSAIVGDHGLRFTFIGGKAVKPSWMK